ncbi:protein FAR1-RELATED SEQUENCE 5-like [Apium graveolens]|uniref:protein FAR1-RELATED SEQUENCE 5-like n=1 Tax=Apium graveolens TaxID=4045 RepID=UPI003D7B30DF
MKHCGCRKATCCNESLRRSGPVCNNVSPAMFHCGGLVVIPLEPASNLDNNKLIIDGVTYDGPEGEEDMAIALRRIQMALERKKKRKMRGKRRRVYHKIFNDDEVIDVDSVEDKDNDPGKGKTHSDDDVGFGWKNHDVHGDSDDSNDSFNGDDDDKINDEIFIGNVNDVVPCVGMIFDSLDEAESFYRGYCQSIGFKIIIRSSHRHSRNGGISSRLYICRKGGRFGQKPLEVEDRVKGKQPRDVIPQTCCRARIDVECRLVLLRDLQKQSDGNFFYRVDVDEENRVRGLVWVDPRSLNAYMNFGDVATFDSTYRTNRYVMPFILITVVKYHYQNILFGFALIRDEKETTYRWVLKAWLEAVDNKTHITIITDQDIALSNAIAEVMPNTNHTYCTWHISRKFPEKLSTLYTPYSEFKTDFNACIYKLLSPPEFEGRWEDLKEKYDLENHNWVNDMYEIRRQWVFAFTKQHFAAGMTTTSRSESMNSFFDEYVKASTGLKEFIENSQKALESQYFREVQADFNTEYKGKRLFSNSLMKIHSSKIYTKKMFKRFRKELQKSQSFVVKV